MNRLQCMARSPIAANLPSILTCRAVASLSKLGVMALKTQRQHGYKFRN